MSDYERFVWKIQPKPSVTNQPSAIISQLGDGYQQAAPQGLNPNMKTYGVKVTVTDDIINRELKNFLELHGSWKTFLFFCPSRNKWVKVKLTTWTETPHGGISVWEYDINMRESAS